MNDNILINVTDLKKTFGDHEVLKGINTTISKGEVIAIIGPSGCGKSTFLRSLNLLEVLTLRTNLLISIKCARKSAWYSSSSICSLT